MESKNREVHSYASTTASPPTIQISLDDSVDSEYKELHYVNSGGLISPGTDFSEQGGFFKDGSDEETHGGATPFAPSYSRYRTQLSSVSTPVSNPQMSGCTWHTVNTTNNPSLQNVLLNQHFPPSSPSGNPLSSLTQQIQMAMMMENSGVGVDNNAAMQMTEVLMNTVSGLNTLRLALGEGVLGEFLALLLKDNKRQESSQQASARDAYLPNGLLDN